MVNSQSYVPMVEVTRGQRVESLHRGAVAVVDSRGRLFASLGNPKEPVFVRSSAKPFQALALVCSGAADALKLTEEELAIICASHSGEPQHIELVQSVLRKAGLRTSDLRCGIHPPFDPGARRALAAAGEEPGPLHNNCSGKHAGMLAAARHLGLPLADYCDPRHDIQVAIRGLLAFLSGLDPEEVGVAMDGCAVPTFHLPLRSFALAMARLAAAGEGVDRGSRSGGAVDQSDDADDDDADEDFDEDEADDLDDAEPDEGDDDFGEDESGEYDVEAADEEVFPVPVPVALARIWTAMKGHPAIIAGTRGRLCTDVMRVAAHSRVPLIAKSGAEGVYAMALVDRNRALGIAIKVEDGAERARNAAALEILFQLGLLPDEARDPLAGYHRPAVLNRNGEPVGEIRARFRLNRGLPG